MHLAGYFLLSACFLAALALAGACLMQLRGVSTRLLPWVERGNLVFTALLSVVCALLTAALVNSDFSLVYVYAHTDRALGFFYRLTSFWAGQEGSLLFWAWTVAVCGACFPFSRGYATLSEETKLWYWTLYGCVLAFFCLVLTAWSNPFMAFSPAPDDGAGLNPILQNPGMIFHPPLLLLGYGGFTIPACLALACALGGGLSGPGPSWAERTRPFILMAWLTLSAGIILGAWWSYMELGWGGYWAWDPVENASLAPWLVACAYLHTGVIEARRGKLMRVNVFLMALTVVSAFFATYMVRGNVVHSLHAFGDSAAGMPLLLFVLSSLALSAYIAVSAPMTGEPLADPLSREGLLACVAWVFLALGVIIVLATLWPVISKLWSAQSVGLTPAFYNRACLPLFTLLALLLAVCPWVGWNGGLTHRFQAGAAALLLLLSAGVFLMLGLTRPAALISAAAALGVVSTICLYFSATPSLLRLPRTVAAHGVHLGFALMVLGVAFSGPYKQETTASLAPGRAATLGAYALRLEKLEQNDSFVHDQPTPEAAAKARAASGDSPRYIFVEAELSAFRDGKPAGTLRPQARIYAKRPEQITLESDTLFSLGNEVYATLHGLDEQNRAQLTLSVNPLVNWIWAGGILLSLFPFLGMVRRPREKD